MIVGGEKSGNWPVTWLRFKDDWKGKLEKRMASASFSLLIDGLIDRTDRGAVQWKDMLHDDAFQTMLEKGSIVVRKDYKYNADNKRIDFISVSVLDKQGRIVEEHRSIDIGEDSVAYSSLFERARSSARNNQEVIENILRELAPM